MTTKTKNKVKNQKSNLPVVTIDVKKWCRGCFRNQYGKYCALGFAGEQLNNDAAHTPNKFYGVEYQILKANDELKGKKRRDTLVKLFGEAGYKLVFKNL